MMTGSLNDMLPEPLSPENEEAILTMLKSNMTGGCGLAVRIVRAMEERFGPAAREVVKEMAESREVTPRPEAGDPQTDLHEFCDRLEQGCVGSHRWERVEDRPDKIAYEFTRCIWAEIFRELGDPDLGFIFCAGDEPAVKSHNPALGFRRTKVLMHGDDICDHVFLVEENCD